MAPVVQITGGPSKGQLVTRTLSNLPVIFQTTLGPIEVLIEEINETDATGDHFSFVGLVVVGTRTGAQVRGQYDCQGMTGTMTLDLNGS